MRKYWAVFKLNFQNALVYRGPMFVWMLGNIIGALVMVFVWESSTAGATIGGYTRNELVNYYILGFFLVWLIGWYVFENVQREIRDGSIMSQIILKPVSLFWWHIAQESSWHVVGVFFSIIAIIIAILVLHLNFVFPPINSVFIIAATLVLATMINFLCCLCIGLLAFWVTNPRSIQQIFFWGGMAIFGGQGIPVSFFPEIIKKVVVFLPYRYAFSFPLEVYFGKLGFEETTFGVFLQIFWIVILICLYKFLFANGLRKYSAFGQ